MLGPTWLTGVLDWSFQSGVVSKPPAWLLASSAGMTGLALGFSIRMGSRKAPMLAVPLALGAVLGLAALLVLLVSLPPVFADPSLLAWLWPLGVIIDMFRSSYHSVPAALAVASVVLLHVLASRGGATSGSSQLLRRRVLIFSVVLSAVRSRYDEPALATTWLAGAMVAGVAALDGVDCFNRSKPAMRPALLGLALLSDLAAGVLVFAVMNG
jgi:hypothetical protein